MKYVAPDYEKVSLNVAESFANGYNSTGCPEDEFAGWMYTAPCEGSSTYQYVHNLFTQISWRNCYSTLNP